MNLDLLCTTNSPICSLTSLGSRPALLQFSRQIQLDATRFALFAICRRDGFPDAFGCNGCVTRVRRTRHMLRIVQPNAVAARSVLPYHQRIRIAHSEGLGFARPSVQRSFGTCDQQWDNRTESAAVVIPRLCVAGAAAVSRWLWVQRNVSDKRLGCGFSAHLWYIPF